MLTAHRISKSPSLPHPKPQKPWRKHGPSSCQEALSLPRSSHFLLLHIGKIQPRALAQRTEGCCKPAPPSRVGPAAMCSGGTRQTQSHRESFGWFITRQVSLGFLVWQVPVSPCHGVHLADPAQPGGWVRCISAGSRQGAVSCCHTRVQARCRACVPFCHKPCSVLASEPCFAAILPPHRTSLLCCETLWQVWSSVSVCKKGCWMLLQAVLCSLFCSSY